MRTDEPDVNDAIGIVNPDNDPVFISCDIEYRPPIPQNAGVADIPFEVSRPGPVRSQNLAIPRHQRFARIFDVGALIKIFVNRTDRDDPHSVIVAWSHVGTKLPARYGSL